MYDSLFNFLKNFSVDFPVLWSLLVVVVVGGTGLFLYWCWEVALKWVGLLFRSRENHGGSTQE